MSPPPSRALRTLQKEGVIQDARAGHLTEAEIEAAVLRWVAAPHGPTPKSSEVPHADTPAPAAPAPSPEPSGGIFDTMLRSALGIPLREQRNFLAGFKAAKEEDEVADG